MDWFNLDTLVEATQGLRKVPEIRRILKTRKDPFDYESFYDLALKYMAETASKEFFKTELKQVKDKQKSTSLKEEGSKIFLSSNSKLEALIKALETYTRCIVFAPVDSQEIAFGYANRSAVLLKLNRPVECLEDISRARKSNYPDHLSAKLFYRAGECYEKLAVDCYMEAKYWLMKVPQLNANVWDEKLKDYPSKRFEDFIEKEQGNVPEIKTRSEKFPCASDAIDVKYSDNFGRHIVATRDIEPGEVLIVEKSYCNLLNFDNNLTHCNNCMAPAWAGIPCKHCVHVVFCSEECQTLAWEKYHRFSCTISSLLQDMKFLSPIGHLKLLLELIHEAGGMEQLKKRINDLQINSDKPVWPLKEEWYKESSLESILTLITHVAEVDAHQLLEANIGAFCTTFGLASLTDFFGSRYDATKANMAKTLKLMSEDADVKFIGGLLIKLALIIRLNTSPIIESTGNKYGRHTRGEAYMPLLSLMNFNCFKNTLIQHKRNHTVVYTRLPVKKDEQIFRTGGFYFAMNPKSSRQNSYQSLFHFTCTCIACRENWPLESTQSRDAFAEAVTNYKLKEEFNNKKYRKELDMEYYRSGLLGFGGLINDFEENDKTLAQFYRTFKLFYERVVLPCEMFSAITAMTEAVLEANGITSLLRLLELQSEVKKTWLE